MALFIFATPKLGVLLYLNLIIILKRLKHNQTMIEALLTFVFLIAVMRGVASLG
ncbi:hypothetical protein [Jeotgalibacillus salarius]|uniref:hypothetical protein n=1 Tax=Jeotgalibacillus salarius TaxID=546023 RepID=UPI00141B9FF9|nr:hypothetical protein [Jeotgalibacillus salarius]